MEENATEAEGPETITDIQNYLASFNKEIQDGGTAPTAAHAAQLETNADGDSSADQGTETAYFVTQAAAAGEGFQYEQAEAPFGTTYYASSDGTYYAATTADPSQRSTIAAYTSQADGTTVLPVDGQRATFQTVGAANHAGLQQIVLAVSEGGAGGTSATRRSEIVAIPASLASQAIVGQSQVGEQATYVAMSAGSTRENENEVSDQQQPQIATLVSSEGSTQPESKAGMHSIRMVLKQPDGSEIEQTIPLSTARVPTLLTNDGQEVQVSDESQLQMMATLVEQAASGALSDGNNQVILNMGNTYQTVTVVPTNGNSGEVSYMLIVAQSEDDKDVAKELDLDMSVYDFTEGEKHGEIVAEEVAPDGTKTRTIRITQKKSQIVTQAHMCNYCNYTSPKRYLLSRHMKSHSEERPHKCGVCERGFKTLASLQNHVNTHTGTRPHCCRDCEASFTTSGELVRHVRYRHTHEKPHHCTECDYASVELSKLKRHMRCHTGERPYQCPHCTYASPDMYKLKRHLRIHTGEKPYECDICQARFTQSNSLKAHKLIHSGNKPSFHCDFCPTTCGRKTDLRIHMQKLHTSDKPLKCKRCGKTFPDRYSYKLHSKTHEGEKCFKCDLCPYASISQRHLESHMLIHTDQKPFRCDECDQAFRQKQLLRRHKNLYHDPNYIPPTPKEKTNECSECGKAFRHKGNLIRHLAIHDPEATAAEKEEALRIGEPKGPGEQPDGEEEEYYVEEEDDDENEDPDDFPRTMAISDQGTVQETEDGQQVVVFEVIQLHPHANQQDGCAGEEAPAASNGAGGVVELTALQDVAGEDCFASAVAEAIGEAEEDPPSPVPATPRRRGRPRKYPVQLPPEVLKIVKVEEVNSRDVREPTPPPPTPPPVQVRSGRKRKATEVVDSSPELPPTEAAKRGRPVRTCRMRKDDPHIVSEPAGQQQNETQTTGDGSTGMMDIARREAEMVRRRLEQKEKDMAECFGFNDDEEETETILSMPAVPGSQPVSNMEDDQTDGELVLSLQSQNGTLEQLT